MTTVPKLTCSLARSTRCPPQELILHTLYENGGTDIAGLESYIRDDVERYGGKMSDLLRRLRSSYREQLQVCNLL